MCGICGIFPFDKEKNFNELEKMILSLGHRGPDSNGFFSDDTIGLGHTRLSILDISDLANQPMYSHNNRYVIVYNGEVYNFKEIANELKINFQTHSDTEIILETFIQLGVDFVHKLNGMFAIAIYDKHKKELFLFRDRLGVKPLYYYYKDGNFLFASELQTLTGAATIKSNLQIEKKSIAYFLHLGYIPEPYTIYENIFKFPAGYFLKINEIDFIFNQYWNIEKKIDQHLISNFQSAKKELSELIKSAVNYRLISDVPYGCFLSGGTDSSISTAFAQQLTGNLNTFSIGFKESKYNEASYAKKVANHLHTKHHEYIIPHTEAIALIDDMITTFTEPFADSSAIPTMILSKLARREVKMTLSGDGGDELFFGYGTYKWAERLSNPIIKKLRKPIAFSLSKLRLRERRAASLFSYKDEYSLKSHIFSQEQYLFSQDELNQLLSTKYHILPHIQEPISRNRKLTPKEGQSFFDITNYLKDDLLVKVDRATMKYGLETRVPFLDYRIVEFAINLSPTLKSKEGIDKYILKEILYEHVPKQLFERPKWGFALPLKEWMQTELKYLIDANLNADIVNTYNIVNYNYVLKLKEAFFKGESFLYNRLWALIILHAFLKRNSQTN